MNTDTVLKYNLDIIESGDAIKFNFNLKCDVFSNTILLWIGIMKACVPWKEEAFFLCKTNSGRKYNLAKYGCHFNWFNRFGKWESQNNNEFQPHINFYSSSDDATLKIKETKRTTCDVQGFAQ